MFGGAKISYKLRAAVHRPGLIHNLHAVLPVTIIRSLTPESLEYQQSSEIENTWPGKIMYSILLPHKTWAAGDTLTALAKFVPISKGVRVLSITSTITETVKLSLKNTHRVETSDCTRPVAVTKHEMVGGRLVCISECHYKNRVPLVYHREDARGQHSPVSVHEAGQDSPGEPSTRAGSGVGDGAEENDDLVTHIDITLPSFLTPSHLMEPIIVTHRVRWSIFIANLDGHTSELRCSLGIRVLDNRVLPEARAASVPTRRILLGIYGDPEESVEDSQLPSYNAHIRDRVPVADQSYSTPSGPPTPSSGFQSPSFQAHSDMQLPQVPADAPLDWITSALSRHQLSNNCDRGEDWNIPSSRLSSRLPSRASSPERGSRSNSQTASVHSHESRGIFRNPFTAITSSFSHGHRTSSLQSITALSQPQTPDFTEAPARRRRSETNATHSPSPSSPNVSTRSMSSYFSEVPDYETASRGFAGGGVPPLTSMRGLPTYDEAST